jgi:hypothetical protein
VPRLPCPAPSRSLLAGVDISPRGGLVLWWLGDVSFVLVKWLVWVWRSGVWWWSDR